MFVREATGARLLVIAVVVAVLSGAAPWVMSGPATAAAPAAARPDTGAQAIIVLADGANPRAAARELGVTPTMIYRQVFTGFAARLPPAATTTARRSSLVALISPDYPVRVAAQTDPVPDYPVRMGSQKLPTGVNRIDADLNEWAAIDGGGPRIDADVAVLDTGIAKHRDLQARPGKACFPKMRRQQSRQDPFGHGTHVAGTIGAIDNRRWVVGVAPGVRLWAVKVLDDQGSGSASTVICGLDWVQNHANIIDVVNMSLGGPGVDSECDEDAFHLAVCRVVEAGIPVIVAADNQARNAAQTVPATWDETIAVSAIADTDGRPGGLGRRACGERDDVFASFSNFGPDVDIAAPGVCILSTWKTDQTRRLSGTSMAAPHVAGAAALYLSRFPNAGAEEVRNWLLTEASVAMDDPSFGIDVTTDPDGSHEPILYLGPQPPP